MIEWTFLIEADEEGEVAYWEHPVQLSVFFPARRECSQLNYGQGEGQFLVDGNEWGVYVRNEFSYLLVLHRGPLELPEARTIASEICDPLQIRAGLSYHLSEEWAGGNQVQENHE